MKARSARGLFRATGKIAHPVLVGIGDGEGMFSDVLRREKDDFYPTPPEPTRAFLAYEAERLKCFGRIWEPAAGDGAMCREMRTCGLDIIASDLVDRGAGAEIKSFYDYREPLADAIVTNPPFAECNSGRWITHALSDLGVRYMALLLPFNWPGAESRSGLWTRHTPARVYLMRWRVDFTGKGAPPMLNAWFVWDGVATETKLLMMDRADGRQGALLCGRIDMATGRNTAKAGNDRTVDRRRITWLVALYSRLARAFRWRKSRPAIEGAAVERDVAVIIAKRAVRVNNRAPAQAAQYERIHNILARGRG